MKIFISTTSFGEYGSDSLDLLERNGLKVVLNSTGRPLKAKEIVRKAADAVGIIAGSERYTRDVLDRLPHLRVISRCGSGVDNIDAEAARKRRLVVASTPWGPTQAVAELTVGLILALVRHIPVSDAAVRRGRWRKPMGFLLGELTFGLAGLGRIGKRVAVILRWFGAAVTAYDINPDRAWARKNGVRLARRARLVDECDVLSLHLPYEERLHHFIGEDELYRMKPGAYLVNTSRGGLVDEDALYRALKSGRLRGAAIDTFGTEPYQGPLRGLPNIILTPHIGSYARESRVKMEKEAAENLVKALRAGRILPVRR